eukprot:SAG25_NODE_257_length_10931_cov_4.550960_8_plen_489_part_00
MGVLQKTKYPHAIWDMNVEGAQWGSLSANYIEQARAYTLRVPEQLPNLIASVPPSYRNDSAAMYINTASFSFLNEAAISHCPSFPLCPNVSAVPDLPQLARPCAAGASLEACYLGGLPWVCHGIWLVYRHTLDGDTLRGLMPLLKRATALYMHTAVFNATDGKLHLPTTFSPEYAAPRDCAFDLELFRWCLRTSLRVGATLLPGSATTDELASWRRSLRQLVQAPIDATTGSLMIGDDTPLHSSLKMWSHIFSVFPLGNLDWNVPGERQVWIKSLERFNYYNNPAFCSSPECVDGGSATGTPQSREGFTYLSMALLTMLARPSLPGGAPAEWATYAHRNITDRFFNPLHVPQLGAGTFCEFVDLSVFIHWIYIRSWLTMTARIYRAYTVVVTPGQTRTTLPALPPVMATVGLWCQAAALAWPVRATSLRSWRASPYSRCSCSRGTQNRSPSFPPYHRLGRTPGLPVFAQRVPCSSLPCGLTLPPTGFP